VAQAEPGSYSNYTSINDRVMELHTIKVLADASEGEHEAEHEVVVDPCEFQIVDTGGNGIRNGGGFFEVHFGGGGPPPQKKIRHGSPCSLLFRGSVEFASSILFPFVVTPPTSLEGRLLNRFDTNLTNAEGYCLTYCLNVQDQHNIVAAPVPYELDYHLCEVDDSQSSGVVSFSQIDYYMELQSKIYGTQWVWISMDAFTHDMAQIGVPTFASQAAFQQYVSGVNVVSQGLPWNGENLVANLKFWPNSFTAQNGIDVPHASDTV
jgi:hypothetical protein